jgi:uncharacterized protein
MLSLPWAHRVFMEIQARAGEVRFVVRVTPRASANAIQGEYQGALRVRVTAPAIEDRANEAVKRLIAERLNTPVSAVRIVAGGRSRTKRVAVSGVSRAQIVALLQTG